MHFGSKTHDLGYIGNSFGRVVQAPYVAQMNRNDVLSMYIYILSNAQKMSYGPKTLFLGAHYS